MRTQKRKTKHLPVSKFKLPTVKMLKSLPGLQKEAELKSIAKQINKFHAEIEKDAKVFLDAGIHAVERAIMCGNFLHTVKASLKHGQFEPWVEKHVSFKIRKCQYYMALAKQHSKRDVLKLNPQNLRQALLYAGVLPMESETKGKPGKSDELGYVRKAVHRLMVQLRSNADYDPEKLLREIEPLMQWRERLMATLAQDENRANPVDIQAEVLQPEIEKRNVLRFSPQPAAITAPQDVTSSAIAAVTPADPQPGTTPQPVAQDTLTPAIAQSLAPKVLAEVTALSLRRQYGPHYEEVLRDHLEEAGEESGHRRRKKFRVLKTLPTKPEYDQMLRTTFTKPIGEWLAEAFGTFEGLKEEYQSWLDNLPESLQQSQKAEELQEAIDGFEQIENEDPEYEWLEWLRVFHLPAADQSSRPKQLAEAQSTLEDCAAELRGLVVSGDFAKLRPGSGEDRAVEDSGAAEDHLDPKQLQEAATCLESIAEAANEISLPGMF